MAAIKGPSAAIINHVAASGAQNTEMSRCDRFLGAVTERSIDKVLLSFRS